ncbi:hypothetical protein [Phosphitispora sp. TUW77]|uniref:hypothetical protein n=1 Tax=Phosphitispora sp. TUW77 TaxID=3152361 RepID=UPI003AB8E3E5
MEDIRCRCGKIVCQLKGNVVLLKCRHCKRFVILEFANHQKLDDEGAARQNGPKIKYKE